MRGWVNNYPHSACGIYRYQFKKEKHHSLHDLLVFQYTFFTCQQAGGHPDHAYTATAFKQDKSLG